jgi:hypothetical protein
MAVERAQRARDVGAAENRVQRAPGRPIDGVGAARQFERFGGMLLLDVQAREIVVDRDDPRIVAQRFEAAARILEQADGGIVVVLIEAHGGFEVDRARFAVGVLGLVPAFSCVLAEWQRACEFLDLEVGIAQVEVGQREQLGILGFLQQVGAAQRFGQAVAGAILRLQALRAQEAGVGLRHGVRVRLRKSVEAQDDLGDCRVVRQDDRGASHQAQQFARLGGIIAELAAVEQLAALVQRLRRRGIGQMAHARQVRFASEGDRQHGQQ